MAWYYTRDNVDIGPIEEQVMVALVRDGTITSGTLVWRDDWKTWQPAVQTDLSKHLQKKWHTPYTGMPVVNVDLITNQGIPQANNKSPPKELAFLGLFFPGLPQVILGQTWKGLLIILLTVFNPYFYLSITMIVGLVFYFGLIIDGYKVGKAKSLGYHVGPWEWFPKISN